MGTLGEVIGTIKKKKAQWDAAMSGGDPSTAGQTKTAPAPKTADDAGDEIFKQQKAAWEKRTGRKWIE